MADVSGKLLGQFVENLERDVLVGPARSRAEPSRRRQPRPRPDPTARSRPPDEPPQVRGSTRPEAAPVDLLARSGRPIGRQAAHPGGAALTSSWLLVAARRCMAQSAKEAGRRLRRIEPVFDLAGPVLGIDPGLSRCGYGVVRLTSGQTMPRRSRAASSAPIPPSTVPGAARDAAPTSSSELVAEVQAGARSRSSGCCSRRTPAPRCRSGRRAGSRSRSRPATGIPVTQYSPNEVKLAVTGDGAADKAQVQAMVTRLLRLDAPPRPPDAADALALALCHSGGSAGGAAAAPGGAAEPAARAGGRRRGGDGTTSRDPAPGAMMEGSR